MDSVWYVSYGSNMNQERFMKYIIGGKVPNSNHIEQGARDNTPPKKVRVIKIPYQVKFLEHSKRWEGMGVAFLDKSHSNSLSYAVAYLVTIEQFKDIVKQENNRNVLDELNLSRDELLKGTSKSVFTNTWYQDIVYLGEIEGIKSYTFTCSSDRFNNRAVKPSLNYVKTILTGILSQEKDKKAIVNTFINYKGITNNYSKEELLDICKSNEL